MNGILCTDPNFLTLSADDLCELFGLRSGFKLFDALIILLKDVLVAKKWYPTAAFQFNI